MDRNAPQALSRLLPILSCPACVSGENAPPEAPLRLENDRLVCTLCGREYPVIEGVPDLVPRDAPGPPPQEESPDAEESS